MANTRKARKVKCIETGEVYNSYNEAGRAIGINQNSVRRVVLGEQESVKGLHFEFVEENIQEVEVLPSTIQNEHDGTHGGHGGATVIVSPTANIVSPITDNVSPTANIVSPTDNNDSPNGNDSPREIVCIDTGEVFANATQASKATGIARQSIGACCNGKRKSAGGKHWQYL